MRIHRDDERGETLIEILIAIVLIGLTMGVLFATITMGATGSNSHKNLATADGLLRNYAESAKNAVRTQCQAGSNFTVAAPTAPAGFTVTPASISRSCPSTTNTTPSVDVAIVQLFVKVPNISQSKELDVGLRTP